MAHTNKRKRFDGEYVRGGPSTLFMTRRDVVETLVVLYRKRYDIKQLMCEAREKAKRRDT